MCLRYQQWYLLYSLSSLSLLSLLLKREKTIFWSVVKSENNPRVQTNKNYILFKFLLLKREKVTTTKITTLKTKKNIEKFANPHNVKNGF